MKNGTPRTLMPHPVEPQGRRAHKRIGRLAATTVTFSAVGALAGATYAPSFSTPRALSAQVTSWRMPFFGSTGNSTGWMPPMFSRMMNSGAPSMANTSPGFTGMLWQRGMHFLTFRQVNSLVAAGKRGAVISAAANSVTYTQSHVLLVFLANPEQAPMGHAKWQLDGLFNPTITVPAGAGVTIDFVNADKGAPSIQMAQMHGFYITRSGPPYATFPEFSALPVPGTMLAYLPPQQPFWNPTGMMMRSEFLRLSTGAYFYLCPAMGHAQSGMYGQLNVVP